MSVSGPEKSCISPFALTTLFSVKIGSSISTPLVNTLSDVRKTR